MNVTSSPSRWAVIATAASAPPSSPSAASSSSPSREPSGLSLTLAAQGLPRGPEPAPAAGATRSRLHRRIVSGKFAASHRPAPLHARADRRRSGSLLPQPAIAAPSLASMRMACPSFRSIAQVHLGRLRSRMNARSCEQQRRPPLDNAPMLPNDQIYGLDHKATHHEMRSAAGAVTISYGLDALHGPRQPGQQ